ncbi:DUF4190 domain-containing protein [Actinomadura napierensis]|uniref:Septum formation-related domain-containing protein n=1 Tax=Actinomadura napierensis TaxID=267854 RepID=A0ABP5LWX5_9ACTN
MNLQDDGPGADSPRPEPDASGWAPPDEPREETPAPSVEYVYAPPFGYGPAPRRTNRFAIVALVTGLLGLVVLAIGFAVAALVQTGRRGEKGRGLAIGGLAASAVWALAVVTASTLSAGTGKGAPAASATKNGKPRVTTLGTGACFLDYEEDLNRIYVTIAGCTLPHEGEVGAEVTLPAVPYPGDASLVSEATKVCEEKTKDLVDNPFRDHIELRLDRPRRSAWEHGDRHITCVLHYTGKEDLTAPLKFLQWGPKSTLALAPGDCIERWQDDSPELPVVDCGRPHEAQVFANFRMHGDDYPSVRTLEQKASDGCTKRAKKVFKSHTPRGVELWYAYPSKKGWNYGDRLITCLAKGVDGPLRHSVMPQ